MTLVTQCSADRLHAVLLQALRWGGDISLAVYVPSAPSSAANKARDYCVTLSTDAFSRGPILAARLCTGKTTMH